MVFQNYDEGLNKSLSWSLKCDAVITEQKIFDIPMFLIGDIDVLFACIEDKHVFAKKTNKQSTSKLF